MRGGCGRNLIVSSSYLLVRAVSSRIGLQSVSIFSTSYFVSPRFFTGALSIACDAIPNRCLSKSSDTLVPLFLLIRFTNFYNKRRGRKVKRSRMIDFSKELMYYEFFAFYSLEGILWYIEFFVHIVNFHSIMKMNYLDQFWFCVDIWISEW